MFEATKERVMISAKLNLPDHRPRSNEQVETEPTIGIIHRCHLFSYLTSVTLPATHNLLPSLQLLLDDGIVPHLRMMFPWVLSNPKGSSTFVRSVHPVSKFIDIRESISHIDQKKSHANSRNKKRLTCKENRRVSLAGT